MDIEEELAELKAELERSNEGSKIKLFVNSKHYRVLLKKQSAKICEICGKEYKITHLCETVWKFELLDLWKHYTAYEGSSKPASKPPSPTPQKMNVPVKNINPNYPKTVQTKSNSNNCGACFCVIVIIVLLVIFI